MLLDLPVYKACREQLGLPEQLVQPAPSVLPAHKAQLVQAARLALLDPPVPLGRLVPPEQLARLAR